MINIISYRVEKEYTFLLKEIVLEYGTWEICMVTYRSEDVAVNGENSNRDVCIVKKW